MSSLLTINHHVNAVNTAINNISAANTPFYVFAARHFPWANSSGGDDDTAVPTVNTSVNLLEQDLYSDLLFGKLITSNDVKHLVPRYNWTANTVYAHYDNNDGDLYTKQFFVITDQYNVFKCLYNNNGANSTIKPTLQATDGVFETGDGYVWKYMFTVDATANTKFTSTNFIPVVSNTEVMENAIPGTIDIIKLSNTGSNYEVNANGFIQAIVDSNNIKLSSNSASNNNYYTNSSIYLKSGFGAGQVREISDYNGTSKVATISETIDRFVRFDLSNTSFITGGGAVGETIRQVIDSLPFTYNIGYISATSNVIQSDTASEARVITSNATAVTVARYYEQVLFGANTLPFRESSDTGTLRSANGTVSNSGALAIGILTNNGSGYTGNAIITITPNGSGSGGVANAQSNSTGKISNINISTVGSGYSSIPTIVIAAPQANSFNANSGVSGTPDNVIQVSSANNFRATDHITYYTSTGNTPLSGLANNTTYYVQFANDTHLALSTTSGGSRISLTKGLTETGHFLQGKQATGVIYPNNSIVTNSTSTSLNSTSLGFSGNDFVRLGTDANNHIRRVVSVNTTVMVLNHSLANIDGITWPNQANVRMYKMNYAIEPSSITINSANGIISNTNINTAKIIISNISVEGASFIIGETVERVDSSNTPLGAIGTVAYSNSSTVYISNTSAWTASEYILGKSSDLIATIVSTNSSPNVTVKNPNGTFIIGRNVNFNSDSTANTGVANLIDIVDLSQGTIEYDIGPTVKITGDGTNAVAIALVNTDIGSTNSISKIVVIDPGINYTNANVSIYANSSYGNSATATALISPVLGHGAAPEYELGARYLGISTEFSNAAGESWLLPSTLSYRKIGIFREPKFANVYVTVTDFDRILLTTNSVSGWTNGEIVVQSTTNAAGIVTTSNSTTVELKNVKGSFINSTSNTIYGYSSALTAQVTDEPQVLRFFANDSILQPNGVSATVGVSASNTELYLTNVNGIIANGSTIYNTTNSYGVINSISTYDKSRTLTTNYGLRFNQTARLTMSSNTDSITNNEVIIQTGTNASAKVITSKYDLDLIYTVGAGSFTIGDTIYNSTNTANAKIIFSNTTYVKLTAVSNSLAFPIANVINNGLGATGTITNSYHVVIVADVSKTNRFESGNSIQKITGSTSRAFGVLSKVVYPDLIRDTGQVMYIEASDTVIEKDINSTEEVRLVIKL